MMAEACDEIVQILTEERFMNKMVVILAGYDQQVWKCGSVEGQGVGTCAHILGGMAKTGADLVVTQEGRAGSLWLLQGGF